MKFKSLSVFLSLLIITVLPFTAYADDDPVGPAPANKGEEVLATNDPYYATAEVTVADQGHIATTAYVKGAYNDTIAAVNKLADIKQDRFFVSENGSTILVPNEVATSINGGIGSQVVDTYALITVGAVNDALSSKRVRIYTTWGGDGTAQVAFVDATPQQQGGGGRVEQP